MSIWLVRFNSTLLNRSIWPDNVPYIIAEPESFNEYSECTILKGIDLVQSASPSCSRPALFRMVKRKKECFDKTRTPYEKVHVESSYMATFIERI